MSPLHRWRLIIGAPGLSLSNLMFDRTWRMKGGKFPPEHPCAANPKPTTISDEPSTDDPLGRFRALYPSASCFPEGDGICFTVLPPDRPAEQVRRDVESAFGVRCAVQFDHRERKP